MKKIEVWKTNDGKTWGTKCVAEMHERKTEGENLIRNIYYTGMVECAMDLLNFLDQHKITILSFYGIKEK